MRFLTSLAAFPLVLAISNYIISFNPTELNSLEELPYSEDAYVNAINTESIRILKGLSVQKDIRIGEGFHCQVAPLESKAVKVLKQSTIIKDIFPDLTVSINDKPHGYHEKNLGSQQATIQVEAPNHLVRLSTNVPVEEVDLHNYYYKEDGTDVLAFVLDTGIAELHPEFEGRVIASANFAPGDNTTDDLHGHGSHVAGIIGSQTYGVAKKVSLVNVRVLNAEGSGSLSSILEGLQYAITFKQASGRKSVANLSLGSIYSSTLNEAVNAAVDAGLIVVVAAGNEGLPASKFSPSSAKKAITVGAINDSDDSVTTFSNYGKDVDIFAPGSFVVSVDAHNFAEPIAYSGTSMASPVVAGYVANLLEKNVALEEILPLLKEKAHLNSPAKFPYGLIGKFMYKKTTSDIVYNALGPIVAKHSDDKMKNDTGKMIHSENTDIEIDSDDMELVEWSAAKDDISLM